MSEKMDTSWQEEIQLLLSQSRVAHLATKGESGPEASMAPFVINEGAILLHLSALAGHTKNIMRDSNIGLMICTQERQGESVLALPRLSLQGVIEPVAKDMLIRSSGSYLKRIPDAERLFSFGDFTLFQFLPEKFHWVGGFGKARELTASQWQRLSRGEGVITL